MRSCKTLPYPSGRRIVSHGRRQPRCAPGRQAADARRTAGRRRGAIDASLLAGLRWRSIGPARGGRSQAVAGSTNRPHGVLLRRDGRRRLEDDRRRAQRGVRSSDRVLQVVVGRRHRDRRVESRLVYVGMGETQLRGNIIQGDGVYKTTDGGKTWTHVGLEKTLAIARIRVHPDESRHRLRRRARRSVRRQRRTAACSSPPTAARPGRASCSATTRPAPSTWSIDPKNPDVLYAGLWEVFRTPHSLSSGGPGSGLFKTTDGGTTWTELTKNPGLPKPLWGKVGVSVSGADSNRVYAIIEAQDGGVFLSDDAGATLEAGERRPQPPPARLLLHAHLRRPEGEGHGLRPQHRVLPLDRRRQDAARRSACRTATTTICGSRRTIRSGWSTATTAAPTSRSTAAQSWTDQDFPTAQFYNVFTTAHVPYHVCGAQQDNSTACVPSTGSGELYRGRRRRERLHRARSRGHRRLLRRQLRRPADAHQPPHRRAAQHQRLARQPDGAFVERHHRAVPVDVPDRHRADRSERRSTSTSQHVWRSTNEGQSWQQISPDLTRHDPSTMGPSGGPITLDQTGVETYATVFTLAPCAVDGNVIWAGSDDGFVHVTRDGGKTLAEGHAAGSAGVHAHQPDRGVAARRRAPRTSPATATSAPTARRTSTRPPTTARRGRRSSTACPPTISRARSAKTRSARGCCSSAPRHGIYVSFDDGARVAVAAARPAGDAGARHRGEERRPGDRHARPLVLHPRQHLGAAPGRRATTTDEPVVLFDPADAIAVGVARRRRSTTT